ncbi:MAG: type II secretion system F family protein [Patescibacteria group bacterium]
MFFFALLLICLIFSSAICKWVKKVVEMRNHAKYLHQLGVTTSSEKNKLKLLPFFSSDKIVFKFSSNLQNYILLWLKNNYDIPKDINISNLLFIQAGLIFICWNTSGLLNISLIPLLFLTILTEFICLSFMLSRRRLLDQLDKVFPQILESLASMYQIYPDLKHSLNSSKELVTDSISQRFLTELTQLTTLGVPTVQSLQLISNLWNYTPLTFLISSIEVHESTGGDLAKLFRQTATSLRRHQQNTKAMQSVMFQNKVSGFVVCALVPVVLLLSMSLSKNYRTVIFSEPLARSLIIAASVWWLIGVLVMWRALRVKV